ncbi:MAG: NAD(P)/FAD-dependent oxidoreductase [Sandaracinaceae bacterium]
MKRRLRTGEPCWAGSPRGSVVTRASVPFADWDVVIVGAGVSGAMVAEVLADGRRSVLVVDRRRPVGGSTLASTALIQHEIDTPLYVLARTMGMRDASRAWRRSVEAVSAIRARVQRLQIACAYRDVSALYLAGDAYGSRALASEVAARREAGIEAELLRSAELRERYGIDRTAAIRSAVSARANPVQLTAGLLRAAEARGAIVVRDTEITDVRSSRRRVYLATGDGRLLVADRAVFCTGYEMLEAVRHEKHAVSSTWVVASRPHLPRPDWLTRHVLWEASDPYLYVRTTRDGRLIVGGEDERDAHAHASPRTLREKSVTLCEKARALLGVEIGKPDYAWAAPFGTTPSGLPFIDEVPGMPRVHAVMGFGGNGFTFSQIASELVARAVDGRPDPDADLFGFDRAF